ncbi:DNA/RNA nuclease SfsA [Huintestinicola sp.]|uniref:DNA/RNA nuclease SfsA n=1 Tax=Huintestinicola sp. TaxID=2981661 RepID=UPI003D7C696D
MKYGETAEGKFISRPNRFIAKVEINGKAETVHVKNTGRCKELLVPEARVILEKALEGSSRKTAYDLIAVYKNGMLINMDSQSPNKAAMEFIPKLFEGVTYIRPETTYGSSRFDFYIEAGERKMFMEVKGCTLEDNGVCRFPDAPTERGVKHVNELIKAAEEGYEAYILFVIQMETAKYFTPNRETHPQFAEALKKAAENGVKILAYTCNVTPDSMVIDKPCKVVL